MIIRKNLLNFILIAIFLVTVICCYFIFNKYKQENLEFSNQDVYKKIINSSGEKFIYLSDYKVYLYDVLNKKQALLPIEKNVWDICVNNSNEIFYTDSSDTILYSYDIVNQKSEIVKDFVDFKKGYDVYLDKPSFLSADCHYVSLGFANKSPARLYDIKEGKVIKNTEGNAVWSPNKNYFIQEKIEQPYEYYSVSLGIIDDDEAILEFLFSGNRYQLFDVIWIDDENIVYKRTTYRQPFSYGISEDMISKIEYFKINIKNKKSLAIDKNSKEIFNKKELISFSGNYKVIITKDINLSKSDGSNNILIISNYYDRSGNKAIWLPFDGK